MSIWNLEVSVLKLSFKSHVLESLFYSSEKSWSNVALFGVQAHSTDAALFNVRIQPPPQPDRNLRGQKLIAGRSYAWICMDDIDE
ncbi:hypothetical protein Aduo_015849 [Ancylostoma duodenale]